MNLVRAAIDIGTHSVRLLVADRSASPPRALETGLRITRLGEGLDRSRRLSAAAVARTAETVADFAARARARGAEPFVFGTAALREADNGAEAAGRIGAAAATSVHVVPAGEEARLTYRGVEVGVALGAREMVLDIGGGSTEFITGPGAGAAGPVEGVSVSLGSVRQTERHLHADRPGAAEMSAMEEEIRERVEEGVAGRRAERLWGVAGSVTQVAALELAMTEYDAHRVNGLFLPLERIQHWIRVFLSASAAERRALPGMVPERATTVIAGTVILREAVVALGLEGVFVSDYDSLWGALDGGR